MYRVYVTDGLYKLVGVYKGRYYDIITNNLPDEEQEETEQEIVSKIMEKGGLHFKE